jgi:hypothetical protein
MKTLNELRIADCGLRIAKWARSGFLAAAAVMALALSIVPQRAQATDIIVTGRNFLPSATYSNVPQAAALSGPITNATVVTTNSAPVLIDPNVDLVFWPTATAAGAGTSNCVYGFNVSGSQTLGVGFSTTTPLLITNACNGTNPATGYVIISKTNLIGVTQFRWDSFSTTQTNGVTPSIQYKYLSP